MQTFLAQRTIPCASCGESFVPGSAQSLYCSLTCKERAKRHRRAAHNKSSLSLKKIGPYWAILTSPTLEQLNTVVQAYLNAPDTHQGIFVTHKPKGFILPPGLRDHLDPQEDVYQIAR